MEEAIAIKEEDGKFRKAIWSEKYIEEKKEEEL